MNRILRIILVLASLAATGTQAATIVQIAMSPNDDIPFLLDDHGQVWAFKNPHHFEDPIKLPNLKNIKKIAPYIALDADGSVFTWSTNPKEYINDQDDLIGVGYNTPRKVEGLQNVTLVASSGDNNFVAAIGNRDIVAWIATNNGTPTMNNSPIWKVFSRAGVKSIATSWAPSKWTKSPKGWIIFKPDATSQVALFDDGVVMGWGVNSKGAATGENKDSGIVLTQSPGATEIAMDAQHTVILTSNGKAQFIECCSEDNILAMSIEGHYANAYIRKDGKVFTAYTPNTDSNSDYMKDQRKNLLLSAGSAVAIQVAVGQQRLVLMLDADHKLWTTADSWLNTEFRNVQVNLK